MSFAYTTVLGVLIKAAILQLSLQQDISLSVLRNQADLAVTRWHNRTSGSDNLISEAEMRSNVAQEEKYEYLNRHGEAGLRYPIGLFRRCWFYIADTNGNLVWDVEERMQVFNDYAGEDRQLSLEEALRFGAVHYATTIACYQDWLRRIQERTQRTESGAN